MRVFKEMNTTGNDVCPICGTADKKEVVLVGVDGTEKDGTIQARQVHLECLDLRMTTIENDGFVVFYQKCINGLKK